MIKKISLVLLIIFLIAIIWNFDLLLYGIRQGKGQLNIVWNARDVEEILNDPLTPDTLRQRLMYIDTVRRYAIDNLGLNDTDNYTSLFDQQGKPLLWVVTGTHPFAFEPYEWSFPVVGTVPYKGYFREDLAYEELDRLRAKGYDAGLRTVGGWSTLGWFRDPILSEMLSRSDGDLANLIIHELVHATIFVKDSVNFNENLASFIGDRGAIEFLASNYGDSSVQLMNYRLEQNDELKYADHILRGADRLDSLYKNNSGLDSVVLAKRKYDLIRQIVDTMDTLHLTYTYDVQERLKKELPNNTYFMSFIRYREKQQDLDSLFKNTYRGDLRFMISELVKNYPYL